MHYIIIDWGHGMANFTLIVLFSSITNCHTRDVLIVDIVQSMQTKSTCCCMNEPLIEE